MVKFRICQKLINLFPLLYNGQWFSFTEIIAMYSTELYSYTLKILVYVTCFFLNCILHSLSVKMLTLGYSTYNLWQNCNNLRPKLKAPQIRLYWRITRFETTHCKKFARPLSFQVAFTTLHFLKSWRAQFLRVSGTLRINIQLKLPDLCRRARGIC